jgi:hypothetical protein
MARFRKKPEEFEAYQWEGPGHSVPGVEAVYDRDTDTDKYFVTTAHDQLVYLEPGDWVRKEPDGNGYYPIKDAIIRTIADEVM